MSAAIWRLVVADGFEVVGSVEDGAQVREKQHGCSQTSSSLT